MKRNWLLLLGVVLSVTALSAENIADYDHSANFAKYHTYSWISVNVLDPLWRDRVTDAIDTQLTAKGWRRVAAGGDASISAVGSAYNERTLETWYGGGFGGGWYHRGWWIGGGPGFATTAIERMPVGTLHIDIFDAQTRKVIWHGVCTDADCKSG
jgi:hypothetical protein